MVNYKLLKVDDWRGETIKGASSAPTIFLFRHAQTHYNKNKYFTGWKDSKLTPFGKKQANIVAQKLTGKKFEVAIHTHLSRSKDTLSAVLKSHPECTHIFNDDRMIERSYGDLSGTSHIAYAKKYGEEKLGIIRRDYNNKPPNGESMPMVERRVFKFMDELIPWMEKNRVNVAISAHGNSMRPFRKRMEHLKTKQMMALENPWDDYFEYKV